MRGKVSSVLVVSIESEDHPRLCGEKVMLLFDSVKSYGSPPPMRGKEYHCAVRYLVSGITPAYAGKSVLCHLLCCNRRDHPRLCGEKRFFAVSSLDC